MILKNDIRAKFLSYLENAFASGELRFFGQLHELAQPSSWKALLRQACSKEWVVYSKRPFGGPEQVLKYLARYTHRVAISNQRLVSLEDGNVCFRYKDYAQGNRQRTMTLQATEFIRRFLLHVLPSGFMRIRYYGLLANCHRREKLVHARQLLGQQTENTTHSEDDEPEELAHGAGDDDMELCPKCKKGRLRLVALIQRQPQLDLSPSTFDTS